MSPHQRSGSHKHTHFICSCSFECFGKGKLVTDRQMYSRMTEVFFGGCVCTVQGCPSTVASLNSCPTVKVTWVVLTEVEVLIDRVSPSCVISTDGFDAAATAILRSITFTPDKTHTHAHQNTLLKNSEYSGIHRGYGELSVYRV